MGVQVLSRADTLLYYIWVLSAMFGRYTFVFLYIYGIRGASVEGVFFEFGSAPGIFMHIAQASGVGLYKAVVPEFILCLGAESADCWFCSSWYCICGVVVPQSSFHISVECCAINSVFVDDL